MNRFPTSGLRRGPPSEQDGERIMLRCAAGYTSASALAAALGFAGIGTLALSAVVWLLLMAALLLAAGLLCGALSTLAVKEPGTGPRDRRR